MGNAHLNKSRGGKASREACEGSVRAGADGRAVLGNSFRGGGKLLSVLGDQKSQTADGCLLS